ncbi:MAG TPA: hypothetical protein PLI55_09520 [Candidatus Marinimicrobia bacterium]|nr:hypothetical protein [Candidatus Neomarinimicrobiota bacterium]
MERILLTLFIAISALLHSCSQWDVLKPVNGQLTVKVLNVEITFDYYEEDITVFNQNWNGARVIISRRESWSEYLDIYDRYVLGQKTDNETAYFEAGDKIKVKIKTTNDEGKDVSRESFFELG